ncbi:MAG: hypothetical protein INR66_18355 [Gordonia polyisoprenivorans]|nr:hypothetical protein [Gordonia polyisoprenivorans]
MIIELTRRKSFAYDVMKSAESSLFGVFVAWVVASMLVPVNDLTQAVVVTLLVASVSTRLVFALVVGLRSFNPTWPATGIDGGRSQDERGVWQACGRDLSWQLARLIVVFIYALVATSMPADAPRPAAAASTGAVLAFVSAFGERRFGLSVREQQIARAVPMSLYRWPRRRTFAPQGKRISSDSARPQPRPTPRTRSG